MRAFRDDAELMAELAALRPTPEQSFAAELDERAAAGFPQRSRVGESSLAHLLDRLRETPPRRIVLPTAASALVAVAIATAIVATSQPGGERSAGNRELGALPPPHGPVRFSAPAPSLNVPQSKPSGTGAASNSGHLAAGAASGQQAEGSFPMSESGTFAAKAPHREIERTAEIVLGADPADVRRDAAKVFGAVHASDGIVLSSSISDGAAGEAAARFELLIPAGKLGDAMADLSRIGEVRARRDSSADITAPIVGLGERLQDSHAKIEGLLAQLADAETDGERAAVEAELRTERRRAAALRARLTDLHRHANLAHVSLRIETGDQASPGASGGSWGIGDALHDAGRILAIAAGVTLLALAVLAPLALIALLAWLATRTLLHRSRERALG